MVLKFVGCALLAPAFCLTLTAATITNGDFEAVQIGSPFDSSNPANIPGWTHTGTVGDALLWAIGYADGGGSVTVAGSGKQFVTLGGGFNTVGSAGWSTMITGLVPGTTYALGFMLAREGSFQSSPVPITVSFASGSSTGPQNFSASTNTTNYWRVWEQKQDTFVATDTSATVQFAVTNIADDLGLDDVTVAAVPTGVPEPATILLVATAVIGLGIKRLLV
jgi:Protein of unknown function (DUF642)